MIMVSGWWLLAIFWIGGCLGILLAVLLHMARDRDDREKRFLSGAGELPPAGKEATPSVYSDWARGRDRPGTPLPHA
jgi:hypothetical protein